MTLALLAVALLGAGYVVLTYNGLTRLRQMARNAWADIDVQLRRRHDLVPNLVGAVQGHAGYERSTLEAVIDARSRAQAASGPSAAGSAERALAEGVGRILALAEAYPDLKAGQSFLELQRSLVEIENHVQEARRYYNAVVRDLNTRIEQFPSNLIAGPLGFEREEPFGLTDPTEAAVPEVRP
ncbi:MAG TPA: LemA family protein [Gemmatimonadales bacterium]|nr:LemA family protein [Gemmatimonadales bacterium]